MKDTKHGLGAQQLNKKQRELVMEYMDFARSLAMKYSETAQMETDDLVQEAYLGLCMAALRYDEQSGAAFKSVAFLWCRKYIQRALYGSPVDGLEQETDSDDLTETDQPTNEAEDEHRELSARVEKLLSVLTPLERRVITLTFGLEGDELSPTLVAQTLHLPVQRIHQLREKGLEKMRQAEP